MQKVSLKAGADYYVPILHQWSGAQWVVMAAHLSLLSMTEGDADFRSLVARLECNDCYVFGFFFKMLWTFFLRCNKIQKLPWQAADYFLHKLIQSITLIVHLQWSH
jgi:hypothetical protein